MLLIKERTVSTLSEITIQILFSKHLLRLDFIFPGEVDKYNFTYTEYYSNNYLNSSLNFCYNLSIWSEVFLLESKSLRCFFFFFQREELLILRFFFSIDWCEIWLLLKQEVKEKKKKNPLIETTYSLIHWGHWNVLQTTHSPIWKHISWWERGEAYKQAVVTLQIPF